MSLDYKNILLHFLDADTQETFRLYSTQEDQLGLDAPKLLAEALNMSILLCKDYCILPMGWFFESGTSRKLIENNRAYIEEGLLTFCVREYNVDAFLAKKQKEYSAYGSFSTYRGFFTVHGPELEIVSRGMIHRESEMGKSCLLRWNKSSEDLLDNKDGDFSQALQNGGDDVLKLVEEIYQDYTSNPKGPFIWKEVQKYFVKYSGIKELFDFFGRKKFESDYYHVYLDEYDGSLLWDITPINRDTNFDLKLKFNSLANYSWFKEYLRCLELTELLNMSPETIIRVKYLPEFEALLEVFKEVCNLDDFQHKTCTLRSIISGKMRSGDNGIAECVEKIKKIISENTMQGTIVQLKSTGGATVVKERKEVCSVDLVVFLSSGWGYSCGGINVFNKLICESTGIFSSEKLKVVCVAPDVSRKDVELASENNVVLISISNDDFNNNNSKVVFDEIVSQFEGVEKINKIDWIGHDTYSDDIALECRNIARDAGLESRCALIHHMAYRQYYPIINSDPAMIQRKEEHQEKTLNDADIVFANGPLLERNANDLVRGKKPVIRLNSGVAEWDADSYINNTFSVVTFGRIELGYGTKKDNSIIKQIYLAVAAWAYFIKEHKKDLKYDTFMKVYGKSDPKENLKESQETDNILQKIIDDSKVGIQVLTAIPYEKDRNKLLKALSKFSLGLFLSLKEGFGMTALEMISVGIPVIISKSSGLYLAIKELGLDNLVYAVDIKGKQEPNYYSEEDVEKVSDAIYEVFADQKGARENTKRLREQLVIKGYTWDSSARMLLEGLGYLER